MGLNDITRAGVEKAIAEFDELGRDRFLEKYGFGPARSYFLKIGGRLYDSKAIAGAAHGYDFPDDGPLTPDEFSGGEQTVQRVLEALDFTVVTETKRNPVWSRDELILALDFYLRHRPRIPDQVSQEIGSLSDDLNRLGRILGLTGDETFRNANGVYMKLMNFGALDPDVAQGGRVGLQRGGKRDAEVWNQFYESQDALDAAAAAIRSTIADTKTVPQLGAQADPETAEAVEGALLTRLHRFRERDRKLVERKKRSVQEAKGRLECEACGFDFAEAYGTRGEGFIECHHLKPLAALAGQRNTRLSDLALVCANCHRMIHSKQPWLTIEELVSLMSD